MNDDINSMDSTRAYKFRLHPDSKRQSEIGLQLGLSKNFYNKPLERAREGYAKDKEFGIRRGSFNKIIKGIISEKGFLKLYSQTRQLEKAMEGHSRSHVQGEDVRPQMEAVVEELKTCSA
jgi:putative transposase